MKITTEPRKLALAMLNEMHATMGTELVYKTKFEKLAVDKIAEKHIAAALEAQAKQIEARQSKPLDHQAPVKKDEALAYQEGHDALLVVKAKLENEIDDLHKQIKARQAEADYWRARYAALAKK